MVHCATKKHISPNQCAHLKRKYSNLNRTHTTRAPEAVTAAAAATALARCMYLWSIKRIYRVCAIIFYFESMHRLKVYICSAEVLYTHMAFGWLVGLFV